MCGITAIINKKNISCAHFLRANEIIGHRGPDDEGYALYREPNSIDFFAGKHTAKSSREHYQLQQLEEKDNDWKVALGHRRLAILDLSPTGHQPMSLDNDLIISYNGEIYNYIEIRNELALLGYQFRSGTDTEVVLAAWKEWGVDALTKFNGMFAFVLLDLTRKQLFAVRDRFGVKPLYFTITSSYIALASEVKQLRVLPDYQFRLDRQITYDYLRYSKVDHEPDTFEEGIQQIMPGQILELNLRDYSHHIRQWYRLHPQKWVGKEVEAIEKFRFLLKDSVRLRLRSDVPVGSALSGGLDSSTIVCLMNEILLDQGEGQTVLQTVTSCNRDKKFDEWEFAKKVIAEVGAKPHRVFPSFEKLLTDLNRFIWHLDYPFGSTSQFSQWCVFEGARQAGLTVMIDGQGADEQLAGYGGNDMSLYIGLLGKKKFGELFKEIYSYKKYREHWPIGFVLGALQYHLPRSLMNRIPDRYRVFKQHPPIWLNNPGLVEKNQWPSSLSESLQKQVQELPLPSLLRYEDRNSMAFSIESRVPFMDYRLIEFTLGLPENLVYRRGERKYILRNAFRGSVPELVLSRKDKMGFVSAEEQWLKQEGSSWFEKMLNESSRLQPLFLDSNKLQTFLREMQTGKIPFNFDPWRIICLGQWLTIKNETATSIHRMVP